MDGYGGSNDNHPLTNGTYDDGPPLMGIDGSTGNYVEFDHRTLDGEPITDHRCIVPDHRLTTFTVTVRSIGAVPVDQVRHLIQQKFEVTNVEVTGGTIFAK